MISRMGRTDMGSPVGILSLRRPELQTRFARGPDKACATARRRSDFAEALTMSLRHCVYNTQPMPVRLEAQDDVAVVIVDNPPVNALSAGVPEAIAEAVAKAAADPAFRAIVVMGAGRTFIAGADISE